jgi:hypothetical protein
LRACRALPPGSGSGARRTCRDIFLGSITIIAANVVCWQTRSALVAALSHFPELENKLELHGSGRNAYLTENQVDALWN